MKRKLTEKQKAFCDYYIETLNATESYIRAGYKVKSEASANSAASRLLRNVKVKSYIDKRLKQIESERIADAKEVMQYLTSVMRGEEIEEIVGFTEEGPEKISKLPNVKDRVKAAELLGRRYSLFTDKVDIEGNIDTGTEKLDSILKQLKED